MIAVRSETAGDGLDLRRVRDLLERAGVTGGAAMTIEPLTGGVSSDVFRVELGDRALCAKFAVERLRVAREWRAPLRRSEAERRWLAFAGRAIPGTVPRVIGHDAASHGILMEFLPPETHPIWKSELLAGRVDAAFAEAVGRTLATIHAASVREPGLAERFANQQDFEALRLDPYLRFTAARHLGETDRLNALADAQADARIALVHGDISPKNILCGPDGPVFIDAECATFGDPAFDVAFCLNHLIIKAIVLKPDRDALRRAARALWAGYRNVIDWEPPAALEQRAARLLPALMLARVDGKSPLEYLDGATAAEVRARALAHLANAPDGLAEILDGEAS